MKTPKEWIEELNRPEYVTLPCATVHKSDIAAIQQDAQSSAWECARLRKAIEETIADNLHLSDGEDCTFIKLKRALNSEREETPKKCEPLASQVSSDGVLGLEIRSK